MITVPLIFGVKHTILSKRQELVTQRHSSILKKHSNVQQQHRCDNSLMYKGIMAKKKKTASIHVAQLYAVH